MSQQTFFYKETVNILGFAGHRISVATTEVCPCGLKAAIDDI